MMNSTQEVVSRLLDYPTASVDFSMLTREKASRYSRVNWKSDLEIMVMLVLVQDLMAMLVERDL